MNVYGIFETPEEAAQRRKDFEAGIVRYHNTTYLEYDIPIELEEELSEYIGRRVLEFNRGCNCQDCKKYRK